VGILEPLLPNQDGILKSPVDLYIDREVDEELKKISAAVGLGLSAKLLALQLFLEVRRTCECVDRFSVRARGNGRR